MEQPEEFEHIPWSELSTAHETSRNRMVYLAAGALVALAVGAIGARSLMRPAPAAVAEEEVVSTTQAPPVPESTAPVVVPSPVQPALYTEADLMAALPVGDGVRAAVARAEWFVADYFTADLDPLRAEPIRSVLPTGADVPPLPQDRETPPVSFVEWSRAFDAAPFGDDAYRIAVAYRSIGSTPDGRFRRLPVRAVAVTVIVGNDGGTSVADLPSPLELPQGPVVPPWPETYLELPDSVIGEALQQAARWGEHPQIVGGAQVPAGWRVAVTVQDEVGNRWPLSLQVAEANVGASP